MQQAHKSLKKNQLPLCTESLKKKKKKSNHQGWIISSQETIIIKNELQVLCTGFKSILTSRPT